MGVEWGTTNNWIRGCCRMVRNGPIMALDVGKKVGIKSEKERANV